MEQKQKQKQIVDKPSKNLKQKGNQFYKQGEYYMAINMYKKYVSKPHTDNKNAYYNMSLCMFKVQKYQECIEACKQALRIDENYLKVYYRIALAFQKIGNQYQTYVNATQFCQKSDQKDKNSNQYMQMKKLKQTILQKIVVPHPVSIQPKNRIFFGSVQEQIKNKNNQKAKNSNQPAKFDDSIYSGVFQQEKRKQRKNQRILPSPQQKAQYFKGYNWFDVQKIVDQGNLALALNMAYCICKNSDKKNKQANQSNLKILKGIKSGIVSKDMKIITDITQLQRQSKQDGKNSGLTTQNQVCLQKNQQVDKNNQVQPQKSSQQTKKCTQIQTQTSLLKKQVNEQQDIYSKYFLMPLSKKMDIFQGFPVVILSILQKVQILSKQKLTQLLLRITRQYDRFLILQMSMSDQQKKSIKKQMDRLQIQPQIIKEYCQ